MMLRSCFALLLFSLVFAVPVENGQDERSFAEALSAFQGIGPVLGEASNALAQEEADYDYSAEFAEFKKSFLKAYKDEQEHAYRYTIFCENMAKVKLLQATERGTAVYGPTKFADLTDEEFSRYVMDTKFFAQGHELRYDAIPSGPVPDSVDWRSKGAVTPVKDQGQCGSCWAFSTTGNVEGQWFIKKAQLVSLSEQELVSCDTLDQGCQGGLPSNAYKQIISLGGLETEKDYPYDAEDEKCSIKSKPAVYINDSVAISQDEGEMASWLAQNGPISIGINANVMQFYIGGISHPWKIFCSPDNLDHGVLIVGYGTENGTPYWIVKNSWGVGWGEQGYYRVYRGDGTCGLNKMCTSSVVD